jgi:hypothetical protein
MYRLILGAMMPFVLDCTPAGHQPSIDAAPYTNACEAIAGKTFISREDLPIGESQNGTRYGRWLLVFSSGMVCWGHDDALRDDGTYACEGWQLRGHFSGSEKTGQYLPDTGLLAWGGTEYVVRTVETPGHAYCQN